MPVRITNKSTEEQILALAEIRNQSPARAVHQAVCEAIDVETDFLELTGTHLSAVKRVEECRIGIAVTYAADDVLRGMGNDARMLVVAFFIILALSLFSSSDFGRTAVVLILVVLVTAAILMERSLSRKSTAREYRRRFLELEIDSLKSSLPDDLEFLASQPDRFPIWSFTVPEGEKNTSNG
jgi:hypothetical protein